MLIEARPRTIIRDARNELKQSQRFQQWRAPSYRDAGDEPATERHYSRRQVAEMWGVSEDTVTAVFENEPGVLVIGETNPKHKRRYRTLRIPQSVVLRVHRRLSSGGAHARCVS